MAGPVSACPRRGELVVRRVIWLRWLAVPTTDWAAIKSLNWNLHESRDRVGRRGSQLCRWGGRGRRWLVSDLHYDRTGDNNTDNVTCTNRPNISSKSVEFLMSCRAWLSRDATVPVSDLAGNRTTAARNKINFIRIPQTENILTETPGQFFPFQHWLNYFQCKNIETLLTLTER